MKTNIDCITKLYKSKKTFLKVIVKYLDRSQHPELKIQFHEKSLLQTL